MKCFITILLFFSFVSPAPAQYDLIHQLETTTNDTLRVKLLGDISSIYGETNPDSSYYYSELTTTLCQRLGYRLSEAFAINGMGYALMNKGDYPRALQVILSGIQIAEDQRSENKIAPAKYLPALGADTAYDTPRRIRLQTLAWLYFNLGALYENAGDVKKEMAHYVKSLDLAEQSGTVQIAGVSSMALGRLFLHMKQLDSALLYVKKAHEISKLPGFDNYTGSVLLNVGRVYLARGDKEQGLSYVREAVIASGREKYFRGVIAGNLLLSDVSIQDQRIDSGFYFVRKALQLAETLNSPDLLLRCYTALAALYKSRSNNDSTVKYQGLIIRIKDSLFNSKQAQQFRNIDSDAEQRQREIEVAKKDYRNRLQMFALISGLAVFLFVAIILWRNNRTKQRAYMLLAKQKQETDVQKTKVEQALHELKSTQAQLVQREKMASLGELTAGVAHEIQNPLNFVNNFSDVNVELVDELKTELGMGNMQSANEIADSIKDNEQKINHHGKRADAIVKGMLQHSRTSSGQKELTDINRLAEEYLRLAYHGLRANDKRFNAKIETDFDPNVGKINVVPQDIARVLLNLINNAFYALSERAAGVKGRKGHSEYTKGTTHSYEPTVTVRTESIQPPSVARQRLADGAVGGGSVEIKVIDNGAGIPQNIVDKIFQPFFTTKPTGEGTGLGLSLAYDILKAHGGEIKVETKEGEGSEFVVRLPI